MSQTSPFGSPVPDEPGTRPAEGSEASAPPEKRARVGLLAIGGTAVVGAAALAGFLLMSGTSDGELGVPPTVAQGPRATQTPTPSVSASPLPTESTANARNPFLAPPSPAASASPAGGTGQTPSTPGGGSTPAPGSTPGTTPGTTPTTPASSPTRAARSIAVTLASFDTDTYRAKFRVSSPAETDKAYKVDPGEDFGAPLTAGGSKPLIYNGVVTLANGKECTSVKFVDAPPVQICLGGTVTLQ